MQGQAPQQKSLTKVQREGDLRQTTKTLSKVHAARAPPHRQKPVTCVLADKLRKCKAFTGVLTPDTGQIERPVSDLYAVAYKLVALDAFGNCQVFFMTNKPRIFIRKLEMAHFQVQTVDQAKMRPKVVETNSRRTSAHALGGTVPGVRHVWEEA